MNCTTFRKCRCGLATESSVKCLNAIRVMDTLEGRSICFYEKVSITYQKYGHSASAQWGFRNIKPVISMPILFRMSQSEKYLKCTIWKCTFETSIKSVLCLENASTDRSDCGKARGWAPWTSGKGERRREGAYLKRASFRK